MLFQGTFRCCLEGFLYFDTNVVEGGIWMKVLVTRKLQEEIIAYLREHVEVDMWEHEETVMPRAELLSRVRDVEAVLSMLSERMDAEVFDVAPHLKVVANMAVGYNNIDVAAAHARGIVVTNTPDVLTDTTADLAFALLLATARRVVEASDYLREGKWQSWYPTQLVGRDVSGATIGIFGMGRIGSAVARRAMGFGMNILYHNRSRNEEAERLYGARYVSKEELLREADFVVILMPFTEETVGYIGEAELALMKKTAVLVNVARGGIVDEKALYEALVNGQIWAAGLDVFTVEPVDLAHPLLTLPNVVALPHIGSASIETRLAMARLAAENVVSVLTKNEALTEVKGRNG